jgi:pantoate--beta-alanine ligase
VRLITTVAALRAQSRAWKAEGRPVALVPTMGALHEGHLSLVRAAQAGVGSEAVRVIVSIFVNPLQFGPGEDFEHYPRSLDQDLLMLAGAGADAVFNPPVDEMYPPGFDTQVTAGAVAGPLEGAARPGHFDGVVTVVARLFGASLADHAYFGQKDAQQLAVIRRMAQDLAIPVEVVDCPTVREADGLAMSSRNRYLHGADRGRAVALVRALAEAQALRRRGVDDIETLETEMGRVLEAHPGIRTEYARVVDPQTFAPPAAGRPGLAVIAARVGGARLIDNAPVSATDLIRYRAPVPAIPADPAVAV